MRLSLVALVVLSSQGCGGGSRTVRAPRCTPSPESAGPGAKYVPLARHDLVGEKVRSVEIAGAPPLLMGPLAAGLSVRAGEPLTTAHLQADVFRLWELGVASEVSVEGALVGGEVLLTYRLVPYVPIVSVTMHGGGDRALAGLAAQSGALADPRRIERLRRRSIERLVRAGFLDAAIAVTRSRSGGGERLCVDVTRGAQYVIDRFETTGGAALGPRAIERMLARRAGTVNAVGGRYDATMLRGAVEDLKLAFRDRGYVGVQVADPVTTIDRGNKRIRIQLAIEQGEIYRVGTLVVPWQLREPTGLALGAVFSQLALDRLLDRLQQWGDARGIEVRMDAAVRAASHTVDIAFSDAAAVTRAP